MPSYLLHSDVWDCLLLSHPHPFSLPSLLFLVDSDCRYLNLPKFDDKVFFPFKHLVLMHPFFLYILKAMGRTATSLSKLADTAREELPSTMAAIRLSGMEISDLTLELSDLR